VSDFTYADPATVRGRLQRGRGRGAQDALTAHDAADLVYECVMVDSRWDQVTEERDRYLARLVDRLDLSLLPLERHLFTSTRTHRDEVELTLQVLALLTTVGRADAVRILRRYALEGRHWADALELIASSWTDTVPEIWDGLGRDIIARYDDVELADHVYTWQPWTSWAETQPRIRRILDQRAAGRADSPRGRPASDDLAILSSAELIERAISDTDRRRSLRELGRRGDSTVLDLAEDPSLRNAAGWPVGMPQALRELGTAAVARARTWIESGDSTVKDLAVSVLADFGDRGDGAFLLEALATATRAGAWCAAETPARGLGRLGISEATDALVHAWETTVHSVAREHIFAGLRGCAPDTAAHFAVEGLEDCERHVQIAACSAVPGIEPARIRLADLCRDPFAPDVHDAARQRLVRLSAPRPPR
jgi:hypothetical protein